ncbi:MAG: hypothetical protein OXF99_01280 [bacterium]|nr:hypothetical protein [bacterium]
MNRSTLANRISERVASISKINTAVLIGVLAIVVAVVALQVRDHPQFSPLDEIQHFDYALKSPSAGVRTGEHFGLETMRVVACRGLAWPGWAPGSPRWSECGDPLPDPTRSHSNGYNTAYQHTPVYYTATALAGDVVVRLPGIDSTLVAYRLVGAAWLAAGLLLVWYALGLVNVGIWGRAAVVGLLGVSPVVVHGSAFLNPDATAILGGGVVLVALLKWELGKWPWWSVAAASFVAVGLKLTNASAVGVVVLYLAFRIWQQREKLIQERLWVHARQRVLVAVTSTLVTLASVLAWRLWQGYRQLDEEKSLPIFTNLRHSSFQWTSLDDQLRAVVTPFRDQWIPAVLPRSVLAPLGGIADIGLLVLLAAAVAIAAVKSAQRALVAGVFAAMVGMGVVTMITFHLALGLDSLTPGRYGLALLPFAAVAVAPVMRRHVMARVLVGAVACATAAAMLHGVLFYGPKMAIAAPPDNETTMGVWCSTTSTSYFWRWNELGDDTVYHVSFDGWSWEEHEGTTLRLTGQPANTEAVLYVQAGSADEWDMGPSGSKACRTAPEGKPNVTCATTSTSYIWTWDPVDHATWYRVRWDPAHPWFETNRLTTTIDRERFDAGNVLYLHAGNPDSWNVEGTVDSVCPTQP